MFQDFTQYCTMVDHARLVDVDSSMAKKQWSTDEFQHVLAVHTEQVRVAPTRAPLNNKTLSWIFITY